MDMFTFMLIGHSTSPRDISTTRNPETTTAKKGIDSSMDLFISVDQ